MQTANPPRLTASIRTRLLLLVLSAVVVPLAVVGWWISGTAAASGESLLRDRLRQTLEPLAVSVIGEWSRHRSALYDFADDPLVLDALLTTLRPSDAPDSPLRQRFEALPPGIVEIEIQREAATVARLSRSHRPTPD